MQTSHRFQTAAICAMRMNACKGNMRIVRAAGDVKRRFLFTASWSAKK